MFCAEYWNRQSNASNQGEQDAKNHNLIGTGFAQDICTFQMLLEIQSWASGYD